MIEGGNPRHICIDLTHFTSQSKIFDTAVALQFPCQVLLMVSKIRVPEAIGTSAKYDGGMTALSYIVRDLMHSVDILLASKILHAHTRSNIRANFQKKARLSPRLKITDTCSRLDKNALHLPDEIKQTLLPYFSERSLSSIKIRQLRL